MNIIKEKVDIWNKAAYLKERMAAVSAVSPSFSKEMEEKWQNTTGLTDEMFLQRLAEDGLGIEDFQSILESREAPSVQLELPWITKLAEIIHSDNLPEYKSTVLENKTIPFRPFFVPFLTYANFQLEKHIQRLLHTYPNERVLEPSSVIDSILQTLLLKLQELSLRSLITELHIARMSNSLEGATPEERYIYFEEDQLTRPEKIVELLEVYPVLARLMVEIIEGNMQAQVETLERFFHDRKEIMEAFEGDFVTLVQVKAGEGDTHQGGRTVTTLLFQSGEQLVYKPRSLAIDLHFRELLEWINSKGFSHPLISTRILHRTSYGWSEFIKHKQCEETEKLQRYYYRFGSFIALAYLLRSSDFHAENIIACGEYPVLIDLETLFSNDLNFYDDVVSFPSVLKELNHSVFGTLMVPITYPSTTMIDVDISALGGKQGQESQNVKVWMIDKARTDEMCLVQKPYVSTATNNHPIWEGKAIDASDYANEVLSGFEEMYQLFLTHREELLSSSGPISRFANDYVRHIFRATHIYAKFLESSSHPHYLEDGLQRVQLFDYLWKLTSLVPKLTEIVSMECRDLLAADVPYFTLPCDGTSVYDSRGQEVPHFFEKSCIELVMEKCQELSHEDCLKQMRYIRMSLATLKRELWTLPTVNKPNGIEVPSSLDRSQFLTVAQQLADHILQQAVWSKDHQEAFFIGLNLSNEEKLGVSPFGPGLYDGALGVSLFLAYVGKETGEDKYSAAAQAIVAGMFLMLKEKTLSLSAFHGITSVVYSLVHLGVIWDDQTLLTRALSYLPQIEALLDTDPHRDLVGGTAGIILCCLQVYAHTQDEAVLNVAIKSGHVLVRYIEEAKKATEPMLAGLSHGAAGFAWALLELASVTQQKEFHAVGQQLLEYERTLFSEREGNWADLRKQSNTELSPVYWCHGAPGIGLGRVMTSRHFKDEQIKHEIALCVEKTLADGFGLSHCLCHGDFGNLDFLLVAAKELQSEEVELATLQAGYKSMKQGLTEGWVCGLNREAELIGFMLGLSGIGYSLLRLWNPEIPSVLALQLPTSNL